MKKTKKMQKTIIALVLSIIMALSGSTAAFADGETVEALSVENTSIAAIGMGISVNRNYYLGSINPYVTYTYGGKEYISLADEFEKKTGLSMSFTAVGAEENWSEGGTYQVKATAQEWESIFDVTISESQIDKIECEDMTVQKSGSYVLTPKFTVYMKDKTTIESVDGTVTLSDYGYSENFVIDSYSKNQEAWEAGDEVTVNGKVLGVSCSFKVTVEGVKYTRFDVSDDGTLKLTLTDSAKQKKEWEIDDIILELSYVPADYLKENTTIVCTLKSGSQTFENVEISYSSDGSFSNLFQSASLSWNGLSSDEFTSIWLKSQLLKKSGITQIIANQIYLASGTEEKYGFNGEITKDNIQSVMSVAMEWSGKVTTYGSDVSYLADTVESAILKVFGRDITLSDYTTVESGKVVLNERGTYTNGGTVSILERTLSYDYYLFPTFKIVVASNGYISSFGFDTVPEEHTKHTLEKIAAKPATETEDGNVEHWKCVECEKTFADKYGKTELESTIIHNMKHYAATAPTCMKVGNTEYWYCTACDKYFSDATGDTEIEKDSWVIAKLNHSFTVYTYNGDATCGKDGTKTAKCDTIGCTATETITAKGTALEHTMEYHAETEPTYISSGNTEYWYCTLCKKYYSDNGGNNEITKSSWVVSAKTWKRTLAYDSKDAKGMFGSDVREIQQYLIDHKYLDGTPSGYYDEETAAAISAFQAQNGLLNPDGMVGNWTIGKIRSITSDFQNLGKGTTGTPVQAMQYRLVSLGYLSVEPDGIFGDMSTAALKKFQLLNSLPTTGVADAATLRKLYASTAIKFRVLSTDMQGDDVKAIQEYLVSLGYLAATPDGIYGNYTKAAVTAFQAANGLYDVDGMCGNWTMSVLASGSAVNFYEFSKGEISVAAHVMQQYLANYGYLNVEPDGIFGNMSEEAIRKFQLLNDLGITGMADKDTLYKLYHVTAVRFRTLTTGMKGDDVTIVQQKLANLGYFNESIDGTYDSYTKAAVTAFQAANGLADVDGMCGNWTTGKLASGSAIKFSELKKGNSGTAVLVMQRYLVNLGYLEVEPDGIFGDMSKTALMEFQLLNGIEMTGEADQETLYKLYQSSAISKRTLTLQNYGSDVLIVQKALSKLGYSLSLDSTYGTQTKGIVVQFQKKQGLTAAEADGMVGNWTLGEIVKELAKKGIKTV